MITVTETSLAAYRAIEPSLTEKQREVMLHIHGNFPDSEFTRKQLARSLGWEINRITGRVLELIGKGYLEKCGRREEDGYSAELVRIKGGHE